MSANRMEEGMGGVLEALTGAPLETDPAIGRRGVALLKGVPMFAGLSRRHLRRLASNAEEVRYGRGRAIVRQGARADAFFVVAEGRARVVRANRTMAHLESGDFFGEMALLDGQPRSASVISETPLTTIRLTRARFNKLVDSEPAIARAIMAEMAARVRRLEERHTV
jgi:CRP/FNR family cyclic AMP-dependent transcriptional regulator